ncbi:uncharacterized protein L201_004270 [Kwoniella dendrophila CBS 6074]|uniref:Inner membrane assembly complex subunit 17 n=1 Tax=Kwoniella dendrophila CBS 6074 TaxID=1295534 RepID=A0AAX4JWY8_9TREE
MVGIHPRQLLRQSSSLIRRQPNAIHSRVKQLGPRRYITPTSFADFNPPPIRQRLKPLIPFFIYWSIITSLAVHLLRLRISSKEELDKSKAKITVLTEIIENLQNGIQINENDIQRELEMVGLRERTVLSDGSNRRDQDVEEDTSNVGWTEVLFGKKRVKQEETESADSLDDWVQVVNEATGPSKLLPILPSISQPPKAPERLGEAKRAPSSSVYL